MVPKIELVISENNRTIDSVVMETSTQPACLVKSLEKFQILANASLTKFIENSGYSGNMDAEEEEDDDSADEADFETPFSPKKKRK